jgi:hypothetical protein
MPFQITLFRITGYAAEVRISNKLGAIRASPIKNMKMYSFCKRFLRFS